MYHSNVFFFIYWRSDAWELSSSLRSGWLLWTIDSCYKSTAHNAAQADILCSIVQSLPHLLEHLTRYTKKYRMHNQEVKCGIPAQLETTGSYLHFSKTRISAKASILHIQELIGILGVISRTERLPGTVKRLKISFRIGKGEIYFNIFNELVCLLKIKLVSEINISNSWIWISFLWRKKKKTKTISHSKYLDTIFLPFHIHNNICHSNLVLFQ